MEEDCTAVSQRQTGFSLIEMLAVVFVVVLLTSLVSLNVGSGSSDISRENKVREVAALLGYALTEAELSGTDHGLLIHRLDGFEGSYGGLWLRRYDQGWAEPLSRNTAFEDVFFEPDIELELRLDEQPPVDIEALEDDTNPPPQLILFAGGEVTPGELDWIDLRSGDLLYRLRWDLFGRMTFMPKGIEPDEALD
ncbi:MAG TPA: general secretion pathway protein GspH [Halieaceae bacterium]|nr:MAG: prepilin-type N-terminal cleavage/methylation domain-containing protein [Alteromonadaceae bacterium TMED101]HBQ02648.1 general secretion pathway protein GspH [Halieaceae bacterium]HCJ38440.1 general secretion pathway protein GspH [Halieaceae bacterium]